MKNTDTTEVEKHAWTGGNVPTPKDRENREFRKLRSKFFREQLKVCGGLDLWKFSEPIWNSEYEKRQFKKYHYYGTGSVERARIFWNAASLDALRTLKH